jgi:hypothetical protein
MCDCKKSQNNAVKDEICAKVSEQTDDEKILEVFGKYKCSMLDISADVL